DVVTTGTPSDTIGPNTGVLLDPDGAASGARVAFTAGRARSAIAGDLDGDGRADLAVANSGPLECTPACGDAPGDVSIALGAGAGSLVTRYDLPVGIDPSSLTRVDLDNDGRADLVMANEGSDDLSILLGRSDGTFAPEVRLPAGPAPA